MKYFLTDFWTARRQLFALGGVGILLALSTVLILIFGQQAVVIMPVLLTVILAGMITIWEASLRKKLIAAAIIVAGGYILGLLATYTELLIGPDNYGADFGFKLFGVPVIIGFFWFIVTLSAWHIVLFGKRHIANSFILAASLVVMFVLILEQFAAVYNVWSWIAGEVSLYGYICWLVVSLIIFRGYQWVTSKAVPSVFIAGQLPLLALFLWILILIA